MFLRGIWLIVGHVAFNIARHFIANLTITNHTRMNRTSL